jgi:hypothetical protein
VRIAVSLPGISAEKPTVVMKVQQIHAADERLRGQSMTLRYGFFSRAGNSESLG